MSYINFIAGLAFTLLFRKRSADIHDNFTLSDTEVRDSYRDSKIDRLIRYYIAHDAQRRKKGMPDGLENLHRNFWGKVDRYFVITRSRAEDVHIPSYKDIVSDLNPILIERSINTVCELGTGDGKWLDYLSRQWESIKTFTGIDISKEQIEKNKEAYPNHDFIHSDLIEYVKRHATHNTLYHTCGGVFEYISEDSLRIVFKTLKDQAKGSMIFLIEPIYGDYDIGKENRSRVIGSEYSYSHNYVHVLTSEGCAVLRHLERQVGAWRMQIVVARID